MITRRTALLCAVLAAVLAGPASAGLKPRPLTFHTGFNGFPAWSADGRQLLFSSGREAQVRRNCLWITSADTDTAVQFTYGIWDDSWPAVSPDGRSVLYMSILDGQNNIWQKRMDADTAWAVTDPRHVNLFPKWFKDGRRILYVSERDSLQGLYVRDLATGAETCLFKSREVMYHPVLSPDETEVYFSSGLSRVNFDIYRLSITGGQPQPWSRMPGFEMCPVFTPDGRHLLWAAADEKGQYHLWVAPLESALKGHRVEMDLPNSYYPAFSRDGKWLAFCSRDETGGVDIWIAPWPPDEVGAP